MNKKNGILHFHFYDKQTTYIILKITSNPNSKYNESKTVLDI